MSGRPEIAHVSIKYGETPLRQLSLSGVSFFLRNLFCQVGAVVAIFYYICSANQIQMHMTMISRHHKSAVLAFLTGTAVLTAPNVFSENRDADSLKPYFTIPASEAAHPDAEGFIGRWLILDPIEKPNRATRYSPIPISGRLSIRNTFGPALHMAARRTESEGRGQETAVAFAR